MNKSHTALIHSYHSYDRKESKVNLRDLDHAEAPVDLAYAVEVVKMACQDVMLRRLGRSLTPRGVSLKDHLGIDLVRRYNF